MSIRYVKVTLSLMRAVILERLSFPEAYGRYVWPDRQIYQSLRALHQALDMEGVEMSQLDQVGGPLQRSERVSLLLTQQILRWFQESFETESGSYDWVQLQAQAGASGAARSSAPKVAKPQGA